MSTRDQNFIDWLGLHARTAAAIAGELAQATASASRSRDAGLLHANGALLDLDILSTALRQTIGAARKDPE